MPTRFNWTTCMLSLLSLLTFLVIIFGLLAVAQGQSPQDWEQYRQWKSDIGDQFGRFQCVTLEPSSPESRQELLSVLSFVVASHSRTVAIEPTLPLQIGPEDSTLYTLDLEALQWKTHLPRILARSYPYFKYAGHQPGFRPVIIRADWLIQHLLDQTRSKQDPFLLTFGKEIKTEKEYLSLFGTVVNKPTTWIEGNSGVALQKVRTITFFPTNSAYSVFITRDFKRIDDRTDPFQFLLQENKLQHDASELIPALPKLVVSTGDQCLAQTYALFAGTGVVQFAAPIDIVADTANAHGRGPELRNSISCIGCHSTGLNPPTVNSLRTFLDAGALVDLSNSNDQIEIQSRYLSNFSKTIERWNQDYETFVFFVSGVDEVVELSRRVGMVVRQYDLPLSVDDVSRELFITPEVFERRLRDAQVNVDLPARVIGVARGNRLPRSSFEFSYPALLRLFHDVK